MWDKRGTDIKEHQLANKIKHTVKKSCSQNFVEFCYNLILKILMTTYLHKFTGNAYIHISSTLFTYNVLLKNIYVIYNM